VIRLIVSAFCVCAAEAGDALLRQHVAEIMASGRASCGAAIVKLTVAEEIQREHQQSPNMHVQLPDDAAHLFADLCRVPYLLLSQQGDMVVATCYGGCVLNRPIGEVAMVFRQGAFSAAIAAGSVPIKLQPFGSHCVVRGLGDVHQYYVHNPAAFAKSKAPRQARQLVAPAEHARPLPLPPPPSVPAAPRQVEAAAARGVRAADPGHAGGMYSVSRCCSCLLLLWPECPASALHLPLHRPYGSTTAHLMHVGKAHAKQAKRQAPVAQEEAQNHAGSDVAPRAEGPPAKRPAFHFPRV
jgi:uncharacterized protein YoaH (UPF0181 family)